MWVTQLSRALLIGLVLALVGDTPPVLRADFCLFPPETRYGAGVKPQLAACKAASGLPTMLRPVTGPLVCVKLTNEAKRVEKFSEEGKLCPVTFLFIVCSTNLAPTTQGTCTLATFKVSRAWTGQVLVPPPAP